MLCRLGLVAGLAAGAALGGPWAFLAPITGFGISLMGDLTVIRLGLHDLHKNAKRWVQGREPKLHKESPTEV